MQITAKLSDADLSGAGVANGPDVLIPFGGTYQLIVSSAGYNGATATLQVKNTDGRYVSMGAGAVFTADGVAAVVLGDGVTVRLAITVAVPTLPVVVWLRRAEG